MPGAPTKAPGSVDGPDRHTERPHSAGHVTRPEHELSLDVPRDQLRWRPSMRGRGLVALPVRF